MIRKVISDSNYIDLFFRNISTRKKIEVLVNYEDSINNGILKFSGRKGIYPDLMIFKQDNVLHKDQEVEIVINNTETSCFIKAIIKNCVDNVYELEIPKEISISLNSQVPRYKPSQKDNFRVFVLSHPDTEFYIEDVSTLGLSLYCKEKVLFQFSQKINVVIITDEFDKLYFEADLRHANIDENGVYYYGISFLEVDWLRKNQLFKYILKKKYKYIREIEVTDFTSLKFLYKNSETLSYSEKNIRNFFKDLWFKNKIPLIYNGLIFEQDNKVMCSITAIRILKNTFLLNDFMITTEAKLDMKPVKETLLVELEYLLNNPYFEFMIFMSTSDKKSRLMELLKIINNLITKPNCFYIDKIQKFTIDTEKAAEILLQDSENKCPQNPAIYTNEYKCEKLTNKDEIINIIGMWLKKVELRVYDYCFDGLNFNDLKTDFELLGIKAVQGIWKVTMGDEVKAIAVAEIYCDSLGCVKTVDNAKIYFETPGTFSIHVFTCLVKEVAKFSLANGKETIELYIKMWHTIAENLKLPGIKFQNEIKRVMADREGVLKFKELLASDLIYSPRFYHLTQPQLSIWYSEMVFPKTSLSNIAELVLIKEPVDYDILSYVINQVIRKNEGMRLHFFKEGEMPLQYFAEHKYKKFSVNDFSIEGGKEALYKWSNEESQKPFKLIDSTLYRFELIKLSENEGGFFINMHHLITDAWTTTTIISKIIEYYRRRKKLQKPINNKKKPSYAEYILNEQEYMNSERYFQSKNFWSKKFETVPELLSLKSRNEITSTKAIRKSFSLSKELADNLNEYCKETGNSHVILFLSAFSIYIKRITGKGDMVIGTPILNRSTLREKHMMGMFISIVPLRLEVQDNSEFYFHVDSISREWRQVLKHQRYPYNEILKEYREKHKVNDNLYDVVISYQNAKNSTFGEDITYSADWLFCGHQTDALVIHISDRDDTGILEIDIDYLEQLFTKEEIEKMYGHIETILSDAVSNQSKKICELEILTPEEKYQQIYEFNNTATDFPMDKTIHELFEQQVEKDPNKIALVFEDKYLTYDELNGKANKLARLIMNKGIKGNAIIALILERSLEMIISMFGIFKAGGAYLPIDPEYPADRINEILADSQTPMLITSSKLFEKIEGLECENVASVFLDNLDKETRNYKDENLNLFLDSANLAYVMYTSGSTGKPKGNLTMHYNIVRIARDTNYIEISNEDKLLQLSNYAFDGSTFDIYGALLNGATLQLIAKSTLHNLELLTGLIYESKVTKFFITTTLFNAIVDYNLDCLENVKKIVIGGERLSYIHTKKAYERLGSDRLINGYGPTEATVFAICHKINELSEQTYSIPIGKPISNTVIYILDENLKLLPLGVPGEIFIGGEGLVRGYLNRPELTAEKFIYDPYRDGKIIYRTGDVAKFLPGGNIEFLDRKDSQVKLRGFRIELGEIEARLTNLENIKSAYAVVFGEGQNRYICAYYCAEVEISPKDLKAELSKVLPNYMLPTVYIFVNKMPMTLNGKIDKRALPLPTDILLESEEYVPPISFAEKAISEIICSVLNIQIASITKSLIELGGDSLSAITIISKIRKEHGVEIPISKLLGNSTIEELAKELLSEADEEEKIEVVGNSEYYIASSAQKRMYLLYNMDKESTNYNMPGYFELPYTIDIQTLVSAVKELVKRHESLRTTFHIVDGEIMQRIHTKWDGVLEIKEIESKELEFEKKAFIKPFDLEKLFPIRFVLLKVKNGNSLLMMDIHHIICDGISYGVLLKDFSAIYSNAELQPSKIRYIDYSAWQAKMFTSDKVKKQENYWISRFEGEIPVLDLPYDFKRPSIQSFSGERHKFRISEALSSQLQGLCEKHGITMYMLLLSAFNVLLYKYTAQEDIVVGSPVSGRNHADVERIVGMFVNTLTMRNSPLGDREFEDFLKEVKKNCLDAFANQDYQFEELVNKLKVKRDVSRSPIFDVIFSMQNIPEVILSLERKHFPFKPLEFNISKFELTLEARMKWKELEFEFEYCSDLFKESTIIRMAGHFKKLLESIASNQKSKLYELNMVSPEEKELLIKEVNNTHMEYPCNRTFHSLFKEQVLKMPNNIAVRFRDNYISYKQLDLASDNLARHLYKIGAGKGSIICIMLKPSIEMVIGMLGILKCGAAFLPIDFKYPSERISYMLEDSKAIVLITTNEFADIGGFKGKVIKFEDCDNLGEDNYTCMDIMDSSTGSSCAYVIYTSGSTGKPKGTLIKHSSLVNLCFWHNKVFKINENDRTTKYAGFGFDASVWEVFPYLLKGAALYIIDEDIKLDVYKLNEFFEDNSITVSFLPTQICEQFTYLENKSLRILLAGGDKLKAFKKQNYKLYNNYGPTENTVVTTFFPVEQEMYNIPIGKPISNTRVYILNKYNQIQPLGIFGELCISGEGLFLEYLNLQEETDKKLVNNPFEKNTKMYRTGDLARWLPNGNIEFGGRIDQQVKLRGIRIEIGEIEYALKSIEGIKDAVVTIKVSKNECKKLVGYYISELKVDIEHIKSKLSKSLPEYMIPSELIGVEHIPINQNGKVDYKALPDVKFDIEEYVVPPKTMIQKLLANIWEEIIGESVGDINKSFFELGGDSIGCMKATAELYSKGFNVSVQDFYTLKTISAISDKLEEEKPESKIYTEKANKIEVCNWKGDVDLNSIRISGSMSYPRALLLTGATGFLGIHILIYILKNTSMDVFCIVRGESHESCKAKLFSILKFYQSGELNHQMKDRIKILKGDISLELFGLSNKKYSELASKIGAIIHTAAIVKHFGDYKEFENINVHGTINIIKFAEKFNKKLAHVSTISVSGTHLKYDSKNNVFTENDFYIGQNYDENVYVKSKFEAENEIFSAIKRGANVYLFRVGNLTGRFSDGVFQKNIRENRFYNVLRTLILSEVIPISFKEIKFEFTPIDLCSKALVGLFFEASLNGGVFHLYNDKKLEFDRFIDLMKRNNISLNLVEPLLFLDRIKEIEESGRYSNLLTGVINEFTEVSNLNRKQIIGKSEITKTYLRQIGFEWPKLSETYLKLIIKYMESQRFLL